MKRHANLPPLSALCAFEVAGRHESFTKAAEELCLTQSAVSRHVRSLETHLGIALFRREHRGVRLTPAGRELCEAVALGFAHIASSARLVRRQSRSDRLSVGMHTAIASLFVAPRLGSFRQAHPDIDLHIVTLERNLVPRTDRYDVCIVMGYQPEPDFVSELLFREEIYPVCAPSYLEGRHPPRGPEDLPREMLLHLDDAYYRGPGSPIGWERWLEHFGAALRPGPRGLVFSSYAMVIQTAVRGAGIALGWHNLVCDYVHEGSLVRPVEQSCYLDRGQHLVVPVELAEKEEVVAFTEWLKNEIRDALHDSTPSPDRHPRALPSMGGSRSS